MSVAYRPEYQKAYFRSTVAGRGNGAPGVHQGILLWIPGGVHRVFSDGYQGESIKHSLMDTQREGGAQNAQQYVLPETHMLALRVLSRFPFELS